MMINGWEHQELPKWKKINDKNDEQNNTRTMLLQSESLQTIAGIHHNEKDKEKSEMICLALVSNLHVMQMRHHRSQQPIFACFFTYALCKDVEKKVV